MRSFVLASAGFLVLAASAAVVACSSDSGRETFPEDAGQSSSGAIGTGTSSGGGGITPAGDGGSSGGSQAGCSDAAKLVYVLSDEYDLYSFDPAVLKFTKIGQLDCDVEQREVVVDDGFGGEITIGDNTPNSMAVDRTGRAWVGYQNGELFNVDTSNAKCTRTAYDYAGQDFDKYGMGFSSDSAGSATDTLYLIGQKYESDFGSVSAVGTGLYKLDTGSLAVTSIGDFSGDLQGEPGELTGTGEGKLFGFFLTSPRAQSAEISKTNAATSNETQLDSISIGGSGGYAFAFSFWGGDFWFYSASGDSPSKVTRLRTSSDGSEDTVVDDVGGFQIVGAGVSTCAPTSTVN